MTVRSLGYRTDLLFSRFDAEVVDYGDHLAVRTPDNPSFHWGNFLLFDRPPADGDFERWHTLFAQEVSSLPVIKHVALGWDAPDGASGKVQPFLDAGFEMDQSIVLTANKVHRPPKYCEEVEVRPLSEDWEWNAALEAQVASRESVYSEEGYRSYLVPKMSRYQRMAQVGLGEWFGAFLDGTLVGDLGIFVFEGLARFQSVETHPNFRRRGICGALVYQAARHALLNMGAENLVMVADVHYHAAKIYESIGFANSERQIGLTWWERE